MYYKEKEPTHNKTNMSVGVSFL